MSRLSSGHAEASGIILSVLIVAETECYMFCRHCRNSKIVSRKTDFPRQDAFASSSLTVSDLSKYSEIPLCSSSERSPSH